MNALPSLDPITLTSPNAQADGEFGLASAISGNTVVVGAPDETAGGHIGAGNAYVFDATTGSLLLTLTSPNGVINGAFGWSVAVSGSTVVVGAPFETSGGYFDAGNAYVFDATNGDLLQTLTSPNAANGGDGAGSFGFSVAISSSTVVVGAPYETSGDYIAGGNAYVFDATNGDLLQTLTSPNVQTGSYFGWSVAVSGSTVVAGAFQETSGSHSNAGNAYVFDATNGDLLQSLTSPNAQDSGSFGGSVAIDGSTVVAGAPDEGSGNAYVFDATNGDLLQSLASPSTQTVAFGTSVAVSGSTVVVGAPYQGSGYTYTFDATNGDLLQSLQSPKEEANVGQFGDSVGIDGTTILVGAPTETAATDSSAGNAYIFAPSSSSTTTSTTTATVTSTSTATTTLSLTSTSLTTTTATSTSTSTATSSSTSTHTATTTSTSTVYSTCFDPTTTTTITTTTVIPTTTTTTTTYYTTLTSSTTSIVTVTTTTVVNVPVTTTSTELVSTTECSTTVSTTPATGVPQFPAAGGGAAALLIASLALIVLLRSRKGAARVPVG